MSLIHYEDNFDNLIKDKAVVDFFATWCGPCKMFSPVFEDVSSEMDINFIKINVDEYPDIARKYGVPRYSYICRSIGFSRRCKKY